MKAKAVEGDHVTEEERVSEELAAAEKELAAAQEMIEEEATISVVRMFRESGDLVTEPEEEDAVIDVLAFETEPARTGLSANATVNMGNYWSLSIRVSASVPCYREEMGGAAEFVSRFVSKRMDKEIEKGKERIETLRGNRGTGADLF